jgi:hypothetical protein
VRVGADAHEQIAKIGKGLDAQDLCNGSPSRTAMVNRTRKESVGTGGLHNRRTGPLCNTKSPVLRLSETGLKPSGELTSYPCL